MKRRFLRSVCHHNSVPGHKAYGGLKILVRRLRSRSRGLWHLWQGDRGGKLERVLLLLRLLNLISEQCRGILVLRVWQRLWTNALICILHGRKEISTKRHVTARISVLLRNIELREDGNILQGFSIQETERWIERLIASEYIRLESRGNVLKSIK